MVVSVWVVFVEVAVVVVSGMQQVFWSTSREQTVPTQVTADASSFIFWSIGHPPL